MQAPYFLHVANSVTRSIVGLVVVCGMSVALGGVAFADVAAPETQAQAPAAPSQAVTTTGPTISQATADSTPLADSTPAARVAGPDALITVPAVQTESATVSKAGKQTVTSLPEANVGSTNAMPVTANSVVLVPAPAKKLPVATDRSATFADAAPVTFVTQQLIPAEDGWTLAPADDITSSAVPSADISTAIATSAASLPPVNAPVIPHGLLSGIVASMLGGGTVEAAEHLAASGNAGTLLWTLLTAMIILILSAQSYGSWLRRSGHVNAARSDITSARSAISSYDFLRLFPPLGSRFLVVEQYAWTHLFNRSEKEYAL